MAREAHSPAGTFSPATLKTNALLCSDTCVNDKDPDLSGLRGQSVPERNAQRSKMRKEVQASERLEDDEGPWGDGGEKEEECSENVTGLTP